MPKRLSIEDVETIFRSKMSDPWHQSVPLRVSVDLELPGTFWISTDSDPSGMFWLGPNGEELIDMWTSPSFNADAESKSRTRNARERRRRLIDEELQKFD